MSDEVGINRGWSLEAYIAHSEGMRAVEQRLRDAQEKWHAERDRRYTEGTILRAEALKIAENKDETAKILAREIQNYRDEQANRLREQIGSERHLYVTKEEMEPVKQWINLQQGRAGGYSASWAFAIGAVVLIGGLVTIIGSIAAAVIYLSNK